MKATAHKKAFDIAQCTDIASVVCYIDGEEMVTDQCMVIKRCIIPRPNGETNDN